MGTYEQAESMRPEPEFDPLARKQPVEETGITAVDDAILRLADTVERFGLKLKPVLRSYDSEADHPIPAPESKLREQAQRIDSLTRSLNSLYSELDL